LATSYAAWRGSAGISSSPSTTPSGGATFFVGGQAHSVVGGSAWEPTPWRVVQRAAWEVLRDVDTER
jgi:hypothetical protein